MNAISHATTYALSSSQSPVPGFGENRFALSGFPSQSLASGGGSRFTVMFGQTSEYLAWMSSHFSNPLLGVRLYGINRAFRLANSAIDAFVRVDDEHVLTLIEAVDRTHLDTVHVLTFDTAFIDDVGQLSLLSP